MSNNTFNAGDFVTAHYKSGQYIGEVVEVKPHKAVVKILAVVKHPTQGDLHSPFQADVPFFHERRALAQYEKALVPLRDIEPFGGDVPNYHESLASALDKEIEAMKAHDSEWSKKAISLLQSLKKEYNC